VEEILKFLQDNKVFYLATVDGDQARVRPMGFVMIYDGKLTFSTNNKKPMFKQMKANPKIEICSCGEDRSWLRISGPVAFHTGRDAKVKALEVNPNLKNRYSPDDDIFELFYFENALAVFSDMKGGRREVKL
jgi:uncharacterized pyridoxamine 5'-phosphate oxidase family protein